MIPKEGAKAPDFTLPDQDGKLHSLKDYRGRKVVIYFYPKDLTPGCTIEACNFRDRSAEIKKKGAVIFGISADTPKSHLKFIAKHDLNFPLLSDPEKEVIKKYGVWGMNSFMGQRYMGIIRSTFIIGKNGKIAKVFPKVSVAKHDEEVLAAL